MEQSEKSTLATEQSESNYTNLSNKQKSSARPLLRRDGTIDMNVRDQMKALFNISAYKRMLLCVGLYMLPSSMVQVFLVPYGAAWFGGCNVNDDPDAPNDECEFDYDSFVRWDAISLTMMGTVSFIFSGFLGRLSDSVGRKPFFLLTFAVGLLSRGIMIFTPNLYAFFALRALYGINGGRDAQTPVMNAYYADVLPDHLKTIGFGLSYGVAGVMLFVGAGIATTISLLFETSTNWIAISVIYIIAIIYTIIFVKESLLKRNRMPFSVKNFNPIQPLLHVADNKIVLFVSMIYFLISLPQAGVIGIILVYFSESMDIHDDKQSSVINAIFLVSIGVSGILCATIILPFLKKHFNDLNIAEIGICGSIVSQLIFALFYYVPEIPVIVCGGLLFFCVGISTAALNSILTRFLGESEQGLGFGIVQSYRALTTIIAPFAFGFTYQRSKRFGFASLPFVISAFIIASSLIITRCCLKKQIKIQSKQRKKSSRSISTIDVHNHHVTDDEIIFVQKNKNIYFDATDEQVEKNDLEKEIITKHLTESNNNNISMAVADSQNQNSFNKPTKV
eukprot:529455_1